MNELRLVRGFAAFMIFALVLNFTLAAEEQELKSELLDLMGIKQEMLSAGIGIARVSDLINEGYMYLNNQNYNKTREIISSVYKTRDAAFGAKNQLSQVNSLYSSISKSNISLFKTTPSFIEWEINYSQREYEKENFEESLATSDEIKKTLLDSINNRYAYLNASLSAFEDKISMFELSKYRVATLKGLLAEALLTGKISELEMIEEEAGKLNISLAYYEEIELTIPALESKNLSTQRIRDDLSDIKASLNIADYKSAISKLENLKKLISYALGLKDAEVEFKKTLEDEKARIQIDWSATEKLSEKAGYELAIGNYEEAESQLTRARQSFESTKASFLIESAAKKTPLFSLKAFVAKNWPYLIAIIIIVLVILQLTRKAYSYEIRRRHLARLEKEIGLNEKTVEELQKNYFVHKKMSRESYDEAYESLQEKIISLKEKASMLNKNINKTDKYLRPKGRSISKTKCFAHQK